MTLSTLTANKTDIISLYEDNGGGLQMYLNGDNKVICAVGDAGTSFEQDAREYGNWAHEYEADGGIVVSLSEMFEDGDASGYAIGEREGAVVKVAEYRDGQVNVLTPDTLGRAAQKYLYGEYRD